MVVALTAAARGKLVLTLGPRPFLMEAVGLATDQRQPCRIRCSGCCRHWRHCESFVERTIRSWNKASPRSANRMSTKNSSLPSRPGWGSPTVPLSDACKCRDQNRPYAAENVISRGSERRRGSEGARADKPVPPWQIRRLVLARDLSPTFPRVPCCGRLAERQCIALPLQALSWHIDHFSEAQPRFSCIIWRNRDFGACGRTTAIPANR